MEENFLLDEKNAFLSLHWLKAVEWEENFWIPRPNGVCHFFSLEMRSWRARDKIYFTGKMLF